MAKRKTLPRVDPYTATVAQRLMVGAMEEMAPLILSGRNGHAAREEVLREFVPAWIKLAGRGAADAAVRGMYALEPEDCLTREEKAGLRRLEKIQTDNIVKQVKQREAEHRAYLAEHAPHLLPRKRGALEWAGDAFVAVIFLALVVAVFVIKPAAAGEANSRWRALAACGVVQMSSSEYERRCRRFSRTERSTVRSWDGPGAGAPRAWEIAKPWE